MGIVFCSLPLFMLIRVVRLPLRCWMVAGWSLHADRKIFSIRDSIHWMWYVMPVWYRWGVGISLPLSTRRKSGNGLDQMVCHWMNYNCCRHGHHKSKSDSTRSVPSTIIRRLKVLKATGTTSGMGCRLEVISVRNYAFFKKKIHFVLTSNHREPLMFVSIKLLVG